MDVIVFCFVFQCTHHLFHIVSITSTVAQTVSINQQVFSLCVNKETGSGRPVPVSGNMSHSEVHVVHYVIQEVHGGPFKRTLVFTVK